MEFIDKKILKRFYAITSGLIIITILVPVALYLYKFNSLELSNSQNDWASFGSYIGGIIGTFFNLLAVIFSLISIIITITIAEKIQKREEIVNEQSAKYEKEKIDRETELTYKQNKPYPFLDLKRFPNKTEIILCNHGLGPLNIKKWSISSNSVEYDDFGKLFADISSYIDYNSSKILHNDSPTHIISPNNHKILFSIEPNGEINESFIKFQQKTRDKFRVSEMNFTYEDIFENEFKKTDSSVMFLRN